MSSRYAPEHYLDYNEVAELMREALEAALQFLQDSKSVDVTSDRFDGIREALALRIMDMANRGERDVMRLRDNALKDLPM